MRVLFGLLLVGCCAVSALGEEISVSWSGDYGASLAQARAQKKPLLVILEQAPSTPTATPVAFEAASQALLQSYVLCKVETGSEYGQAVAKAFQAEQLPMTAIIDNTAKVILFKQAGAMSPDALRATLLTYQSGDRVLATQTSATSNNASMSTMSTYNGGWSSGGYCPSCARGRR